MEVLLISAAVAATLLALVLVVGLSKRTRQDPLRLPREEEWADDTDAMVRALTPDRPSPIDREATVLDIEPVEPEVGRPKGIDAQRPEPSGRRDATSPADGSRARS